MTREIDSRENQKVQNTRSTDGEQSSFTAGLTSPKGFFIQRALEHVRRLGTSLGLEPTQPAEYAADHQIQTTGSGAVSVHLYQQYKNVPVFQAAQTVVFTPDGSLQQTSGNTVPIAGDLEIAPTLSSTEATILAARHVATPDEDENNLNDQFGQSLTQNSVNLEGFNPKIIAAFGDLSEIPTVFERGPFGDVIKVSLIWFPLTSSNLRLCWEVVIPMPHNEGRYRILVAADDGQILYCAQLTQFIAAQGNVFRNDGAEPRQMTRFPLALAEYGLPVPADLPLGFPDDWVSASDTSGNSVQAVMDSTGSTITGTPGDGSVVFNPPDPSGDAQKVLNLFFFACYMHDFFYLLGFRERDGNFQQDDFNRGGVALDRLDARAAPGAIYATANMSTPPDGQAATMNMGIVSDTQRHTAFDATVVFHEFMHGVTNRLVGGQANNHALETDQSRAMGEGWGDFIACVLNNTDVVAAWVVNKPAGIRGFHYDEHFPDDFSKLGTGRYNEPHNAGEIWCATLMEMSRSIGKTLALQLVVDALKLSPANPNFLDMRDAVLLALDHKLAANQLDRVVHDDAFTKIWGCFAKFGMGQNAKANGASYSGNVGDFTTPASPGISANQATGQASPNLAIPDKNPTGITSAIDIGTPGRVASVFLSVDIEHDFVGDLEITFTSPGGSAITLVTPGRDPSRNLVRTFTPADTPALSALTGQSAQGRWSLRVADVFRLNTGILHTWSIRLTLD